jgi:hypothetical protein
VLEFGRPTRFFREFWPNRQLRRDRRSRPESRLAPGPVRGEATVEDSLGLLLIARGWAKFGARREVARALTAATGAGKGTYEWNRCAEAWSELLNDAAQTKPCSGNKGESLDCRSSQFPRVLSPPAG